MVKKLTQDDFLSRSVKKHGDKYDYSESLYIHSLEKVKITCKTHGVFQQIAFQHMSGDGCPICSKSGRKNTKYFIEKSKNIHGNRYGYCASIYTKSSEKLFIFCKEHGYFKQKAGDHMLGKNCPKCAKKEMIESKKKTHDEFLIEAKKKHGENHDYSKTMYIGATQKVTITCKKHGDFSILPSHYLNGTSCKKCAYESNGFTIDKFKKGCKGESKIYLLKLMDNGSVSWKIGITNRTIKERFYKKSLMPVDYEVCSFVCGNPEYIWRKEKEIHESLSMFRFSYQIVFDGYTECFSKLTPEVLDFFGVSYAT